MRDVGAAARGQYVLNCAANIELRIEQRTIDVKYVNGKAGIIFSTTQATLWLLESRTTPACARL